MISPMFPCNIENAAGVNTYTLSDCGTSHLNPDNCICAIIFGCNVSIPSFSFEIHLQLSCFVHSIFFVYSTSFSRTICDWHIMPLYAFR